MNALTAPNQKRDFDFVRELMPGRATKTCATAVTDKDAAFAKLREIA
jgi:hypothetical protein